MLSLVLILAPILLPKNAVYDVGVILDEHFDITTQIESIRISTYV